MADITNGEYTQLRAAAMAGEDRDLPDPADKRSRANFINGKVMTPNTTVSTRSVGIVRVLGPGRGREYFVGAWFDDNEGCLCIGSFRAEDLGERYVPPAAPVIEEIDPGLES